MANHDKYIWVGTNEETAEAIKLLLGSKLGRYPTVIEVGDLTTEEVELLEAHSREQQLDLMTALY